MAGYPISHAAKELGVNVARVRAMVAAGILRGDKIGGRWIVDPSSVEERLRSQAGGGRPLSASSAWGVLFLLAGRDAPWLAPWERSRIRKREACDLSSLAIAVRKRAERVSLRAHPSDLSRIAEEPLVIRTGIGAAREYGSDLVGEAPLEIYIPKRKLRGLQRKYRLQISPSPNVLLRVVDRPWPFERLDSVAPWSVVAVDLFESSEPRARRSGTDLFARSGHR